MSTTMTYQEESLKLYGFFPKSGVFWADMEDVAEAEAKGVEYYCPQPNHYYKGPTVLKTMPTYSVCMQVDAWLKNIKNNHCAIPILRQSYNHIHETPKKVDVLDAIFEKQGTYPPYEKHATYAPETPKKVDVLDAIFEKHGTYAPVKKSKKSKKTKKTPVVYSNNSFAALMD